LGRRWSILTVIDLSILLWCLKSHSLVLLSELIEWQWQQHVFTIWFARVFFIVRYIK
jgi:hypothetical protein